MMQTYLLSLLYLLYGSAFLLADVHGVRFPTLLSLRYQFRMKKGVRLILIILGLAIAALLAFFPMEPGPVLLGDFIPLLNVLSLAVYYLYLSLKGRRRRRAESDSCCTPPTVCGAQPTQRRLSDAVCASSTS